MFISGKNMIYLYIVTSILLLFSILKDRDKTLKAIKIAYCQFKDVVFVFIIMMIFIAFITFFVPDVTILKYLGNNNKYAGICIASIIGSITLMPGFIVFPLCGLLVQKGASYMTTAAFTTSLMMVGILTYPLERKYFGPQITLLRNFISLIIGICVSLIIGLFFGELI